MSITPLWMKRKTAAQFCDLSEAAFIKEVAQGIFPQPVLLGKQEHWYRPAIEKASAILAGDIEGDWELKLYGQV